MSFTKKRKKFITLKKKERNHKVMAIIHIFRRDYRLEDNTALNYALEKDTVLPLFIFDERQQKKQNKYFGEFSFHFLVKSLQELDKELQEKGSKLHVFQGKVTDILKKLIEEQDIKEVVFNKDYTPFSRKRDQEIEELCTELNVKCSSFEDMLLHPIETIKNGSDEPYKVFTPFYKKGLTHPIPLPKTVKGSFTSIPTTLTIEDIEYNKDLSLAITPGRKAGKSILAGIGKYASYKDERDFPAKNATTHLAAHHKFGTVSIRESAQAIKEHLGEEHPLLRQLYWREFYYNISHHFPHVFGKSFNEDFTDVTWEENEEAWKKWCEGRTGFPIVDAGMRELVATGNMHNRVRMITASFLTKDLHIDWRKGERFFAQYLIDYDPAQNNGNWQWTASTGADGAPYFRIFNPWRQQERFDPDCEYIKKWIPELRDLDPRHIHNLEKERPLSLVDSKYPQPMLDHREESQKALAYYKVAKENKR